MTNYYILEVNLRTRKPIYKIGEGETESRPNNLSKTYLNKGHGVESVTRLAFEELPHDNKKRVNDKAIHKAIDPAKLKKVDLKDIKYYLDIEDGKDEFYEIVESDLDIVSYIKDLVKNIKPNVAIKKQLMLEYDPSKKHLVSSDMLHKIDEFYNNLVYNIIYRPFKNILLIGQFEPDFIKSFAAFHEHIIIWHDSKEQKYDGYDKWVEEKITYFEGSAEEFVEEYENMKMDLIIANPPYGSIGNKITKVIVNEIKFIDFINLLPLKDYDLETARHIDFNSILAFAPHSFADADILTHAIKITKNVNKNINNDKELCANAFILDKPMIKFMKANTLKYHYAIDNIKLWSPDNDINSSFVFHLFRIISQHTCGMDLLDESTVSNSYNLNNILDNKIKKQSGGTNYKIIQFNTIEEKQNFVKFYKENRNFINRMIVNQFVGIRDYSACWPKVDWTKSDWTIEKILKEIADYSDQEVKAVLDTMDKDYYVVRDTDIERLFGEYLKD